MPNDSQNQARSGIHEGRHQEVDQCGMPSTCCLRKEHCRKKQRQANVTSENEEKEINAQDSIFMRTQFDPSIRRLNGSINDRRTPHFCQQKQGFYYLIKHRLTISERESISCVQSTKEIMCSTEVRGKRRETQTGSI